MHKETGQREFGDRSGRSFEIEKNIKLRGESKGMSNRTFIHFCAMGCNIILAPVLSRNHCSTVLWELAFCRLFGYELVLKQISR